MRPKYIPTKQDFAKAWRIKQKGGTVKEIIQKLNIGFGQYEHNRHLFNSYFEQKAKTQKRIRDLRQPGRAVKNPAKFSGPNYKAGEVKLHSGDIDMDILRSYVICGFNRDKIAKLLGVSRGTLWAMQKEDKDIDAVLTKSIEETAADVLGKGLLTLCKEHKVKDTHFASYQGEIYSREYDKRFRPHLGAIKYLLGNTIGWHGEASPVGMNNKGAILQMLDEIAEDRDEAETEPKDTDQREDTPTT